MKNILLAVVFALFSIGASAQSLGANSAQTQQAGATSAAIIQPGAVAITSLGADRVKTVGNAPALGFGVSFSADNCASTAGLSGGIMGGSLGGALPVDKDSCVMLRTFERLQQGAASEAADRTTTYIDDHGIEQTTTVRAALKDASYEVLAEISPKIRGILSRRGVVHGQAAVAYDPSGTTGVQPANYRVEEKAVTN